jgi:leader peptidase (prepilin peptidase)/N-methyltransferase
VIGGIVVAMYLPIFKLGSGGLMERQWAAECADLQGKAPDEAPPFNLITPRSRCQVCGHPIRWYENIPVASYLALKGKVAQPARRPSACAIHWSKWPPACCLPGARWRWGLSLTALAWCGFAATLVALTLIDWDTTLLPDDLTLPLLWAGLLASALRWTDVPLVHSVWGAVGGYMSLWLVYQAFKLLTGKEGMGYGDFKLFAALGAWFGWQALVPIILMASVIGAVTGIGMKFTSSLREGGYVPFGPFLALGGLTAMIFGPSAILRTIGLSG